MSDLATCALCGHRQPYEKTRLFWSTDPSNPGTYRTCAGAKACQRRQDAKKVNETS